jgi:oligosaccharide 4-alpha-D-glucosyltransferase
MFDHQKFAGGQNVTVPVDIQNIPVFVKAGSLIPMAEAVQSTSQYDPAKLKIMFYFDPENTESRGFMYEDDGATKDAYDKKMYEMFEFFAQTSSNETTVAVASKGFEYKGKPAKRKITLVIPTLAEKPSKVTVDGEKVKIGKAALAEYPGKPYAYWDKTGKSLYVVAEAAAGQGVNFGFVR